MKRMASIYITISCLFLILTGCKNESIIDPDNEIEKIKWEVITTYPGEQLKYVTFDPSGIFGVISGNQTYFSNDGGNSWTVGDRHLSGMKLISPTAGYSIYPPLFRTEDGGNTITSISPPMSPGEFIPVTHSTGFFKGFYTTDDIYYTDEIWKTINKGDNWTHIFSGRQGTKFSTLDGNWIIILERNEALYPKSVLVSSDGGATWSNGEIDTIFFGEAPVEWYLHSVAIGAGGTAIIAASTVKDSTDHSSFKRTGILLRTSDGGKTWEKVYEFWIPWPLNRFSMKFLITHSPNWLMVVNEDTYRFKHSTYVSYDDGLTWNYGETWDSMDSPFAYYTPTFAPPDYAIGISGSWMTEDGGKTWRKMTWFFPGAVFISPTEVIAVRDSSIYKGTVNR